MADPLCNPEAPRKAETVRSPVRIGVVGLPGSVRTAGLPRIMGAMSTRWLRFSRLAWFAVVGALLMARDMCGGHTPEPPADAPSDAPADGAMTQRAAPGLPRG